MLNILIDVIMYGEVQVFQSFLSKILVHCPERPLKLIIHSIQNTSTVHQVFASQSMIYDLPWQLPGCMQYMVL